MTSDTVTLVGHQALEFAARTGSRVSHYTTALEESRSGLTLEEVEDIARDDPSLVYVTTTRLDVARDELSQAVSLAEAAIMTRKPMVRREVRREILARVNELTDEVGRLEAHRDGQN